MTLSPNNCATQRTFFLIMKLKSKLLNAQVFLSSIFSKSKKAYFFLSLLQIVIHFCGHRFIMKGQIDTYFEILLLFGKHTFIKVIFLCFRMTNRNFIYYCQCSDKVLHWTGIM